jgi:hypothetical protein
MARVTPKGITMTRSRRRLLIALATSLAVGAGLLGGAAPAEAASFHASFHFKYQAIDGYKKRTLIRGSGSGGDTLKSGFVFHWYGSYHVPKPKVTVQRKVGKKWITLKSVHVKYGSQFTVSAKLPVYTVPAGVAKQKVLYRFKSTKSKKKHVDNTDYSRAFGVTYENQAMYTGFAAQMYSYLAAYCPAVAVHVDASIGANDHAGEFLWSRGITIDPSIATYSLENMQAVALHECAHDHQFFNFGASATGDKNAEAASKKIFIDDVDPANPTASPSIKPFDPYEHAADCASHSVQPAGYLGYGGYCNPTELAAGHALLTSTAKY